MTQQQVESLVRRLLDRAVRPGDTESHRIDMTETAAALVREIRLLDTVRIHDVERK
jgi:hypothetical protein